MSDLLKTFAIVLIALLALAPLPVGLWWMLYRDYRDEVPGSIPAVSRQEPPEQTKGAE
jgi:hypothetical protein